MRLGIISALHEEQAGLVEAMEGPAKLIHGKREFWVGQLWEIDAVCVLSRIGKVAAAMTATTLVEKFGVTHILFTGVAGAGDKTETGRARAREVCCMDARAEAGVADGHDHARCASVAVGNALSHL